METILITGATGFLGSHLVETLLNYGYSVVILKRSTSNTRRIYHLLEHLKSYDIDNVSIESAFKDQNIDIVIHTACKYGRNEEPMCEIFESNVMFGLRILDLCIKFKITNFFNTDTFFNTGSLTQQHLNAYILSKKHFLYEIFCYFWTTNFLLNSLNINFYKKIP